MTTTNDIPDLLRSDGLNNRKGCKDVGPAHVGKSLVGQADGDSLLNIAATRFRAFLGLETCVEEGCTEVICGHHAAIQLVHAHS